MFRCSHLITFIIFLYSIFFFCPKFQEAAPTYRLLFIGHVSSTQLQTSWCRLFLILTITGQRYFLLPITQLGKLRFNLSKATWLLRDRGEFEPRNISLQNLFLPKHHEENNWPIFRSHSQVVHSWKKDFRAASPMVEMYVIAFLMLVIWQYLYTSIKWRYSIWF